VHGDRVGVHLEPRLLFTSDLDLFVWDIREGLGKDGGGLVREESAGGQIGLKRKRTAKPR